MSFDPPTQTTSGERLLLAEGRLAALMEHSEDAVFTTDTGGCVTTWSRAAEALFGWDDAAARGRPVGFLLGEAEHSDAEAEVASLVQRVLSGTGTVVIETACTASTPSSSALEARLTAVRAPSGQLLEILVVVRPAPGPKLRAEPSIGPRTRASSTPETADAVERQFRDLTRELDAVHWEVAARDPEGRASARFPSAALHAVSLLGYPPRCWHAEPEFRRGIIHPADRAAVAEWTQQALREGWDYKLEYRAISADGRLVWLADFAHAVHPLDGGSAYLRGLTAEAPKRAGEPEQTLLAGGCLARGTRLGGGETSPVGERGHSPSTAHILLIDDNDDCRETLQDLMELWGYRVETAEDGPTGLRRALTGCPTVALIEVELPGIDGYELVRQVRAAEEEIARTCLKSMHGMRSPRAAAGHARSFLIALTSGGQPEESRRAAEAGFDAHLVKPLAPRELRRLLQGCAPMASRPESAA